MHVISLTSLSLPLSQNMLTLHQAHLARCSTTLLISKIIYHLLMEFFLIRN